MWAYHSIFYQIYPIGFCGAPVHNDGQTVPRIRKLLDWTDYLSDLGVDSILLNPIFESDNHGYDTRDFRKLDCRLGTNDDFVEVCQALHSHGIRVVLDGVFNHVGRGFWAFRDVQEKKWDSPYKDWFYINFDGDSGYHDGFWYEGWEGHYELVKLNLQNPAVVDYLLDCVKYWIDTFDIDGLRLDVSYLLPPWFMEMLRRTVNEKKPEFFLVGEVIHNNNFQQNVCPERLDSITNYEGFRSMVSAFNSANLFEIEHSMSRLFADTPWALFKGKHLLNFVDNHDVERAFTALKNKANLFNLYTLLYTMPGIPCIYYGSEFGAEGDKSDFDYKLRPFIGDIDQSAHPELVAHLTKLAQIRKECPALSYGTYRKATCMNTNFSFVRECNGEKIIVAINIGDGDCTIRVEEAEGVNLLDGQVRNLNDIYLPPHTACIYKKN